MSKRTKKENEVLNEAGMLTDANKKQQQKLYKTIKAAGGDIGDKVRKGEKTKEDKMPNAIYMDNPWGSSRHIDTYSKFQPRNESVETEEQLIEEAVDGPLKLELKNVKHHAGHDGIPGLNADVFINGVKCIHVYDDSWGGGYQYTELTHNVSNPEKIKALIKLFDDYVKSLPEETIDMDRNGKPIGGKPITIKPNWDTVISDLENEWGKAKEAKKITRLMNTSIVFGIPGSDEYRYFNLKRPLKGISQPSLQKFINTKVKAALGEGEVILNTNLEEMGISINESANDTAIFDIILTQFDPSEYSSKKEYKESVLDVISTDFEEIPKNIHAILDEEWEESKKPEQEMKEQVISTFESFLGKDLEDMYYWRDRDKISLNDDNWVKGTKEDFQRPMFKNLPDHKTRHPYDVLRSGKWIETKDGKVVGQIDTMKGNMVTLDIIDENNEHQYVDFEVVKLIKKIKDNELKVNSNTTSKDVKIDTPWGKITTKENE